MNIIIIDDYQDAVRKLACASKLDPYPAKVYTNTVKGVGQLSVRLKDAEALVLIREEGIENCWARHKRHHTALKAGLEAMGLKFLVDPKYQVPQMNAVLCPEKVNEVEVRKRLLNEFGLEIGAGLGPLAGKIWRFGLMGYRKSQ